MPPFTHTAPRGRAGRRPPVPNLEGLDLLLRRSGIRLNERALEQLWRYHSLLRERNWDQDLTRLIGFETMVTKHYVDCLIVGHFVRLPSPLLDIGTGAGFPGIPLKIRYPQLEVVLAEPRPRRVAFLNEAIQVLGLKHTRVFDHKVVSASFTEPVQGIITRALEPMDKTLMRTTASLVPGGMAVFMKGPGADPELKGVRDRFKGRFLLELDQAYSLPHTPHQRRLIVWRKQS